MSKMFLAAVSGSKETSLLVDEGGMYLMMCSWKTQYWVLMLNHATQRCESGGEV